MSISNVEFLILGLAAFVFSGLITAPIRLIAIKIGAMDSPNLERKTQKEPIPYFGGIAIGLSITIVTFASVLYSDRTHTTFPIVGYLLLPAIILGLMGLVDDLRGLPALPRLVFQTSGAVLLSIFMLNSHTVGTPLNSSLLTTLLSIFWIVGICNSINFFDNLDGGAAGTVAISTIGIGIIAYAQGQELVTALCVVTAGATIGFLLWNKSPAKIYMGDAGSLFLGVIVSVLSIRLNPGIAPPWQSMALLPILLAVPILDTSIAVISRVKRGISPLTGGRDHLSHRLIRRGFSKHATAYCLWTMQASFVACALVIYKWTATLGSVVLIGTLIYWLAAFIWFWRIPSTD